MIKLNDRLQIIANRIKPSETMADIGTDHGFLPICLWKTGKCPKVILTDISAASLSKSRENFKITMEGLNECGLGKPLCLNNNNVLFRTGDGLKILEPYEVDTVVIAGMGGKLIRDIMAEDIRHTCSFKKFIFQPRIGQGELRKWLIDNNFSIISEDLVIEGNYIPEIITVSSPSIDKDDNTASPRLIKGWDYSLSDGFERSMAEAEVSNIVFRIPPWIVSAEGPVDEFLNRNMNKEKAILKKVMLAKKRDLPYEQQLCNNISYIKDLLEEYRNGKQYKEG